MLNKTNILALVGGGKNPFCSNNKVIIWDDHQGKVISELRFNSTIKNVKLKKNHIIVVLETQIYVFKLKTLEKIDVLETYENLKASDLMNSGIITPEMLDSKNVLLSAFNGKIRNSRRFQSNHRASLFLSNSCNRQMQTNRFQSNCRAVLFFSTPCNR